MVQRNPDVVGAIVARFQRSELAEGPKYLINYVRARHKNVAIFLGVHGGVRTKKDPLTFEERAIMVRQSIRRKLTILPLNDNPISHIFWARNLDALIQKTFPGRNAILYGSRQSFIPQYEEYEGRRFKTRFVEPRYEDSGTSHREKIVFPHTRSGREAIIFDQLHRPDYVYSTSDLAITNTPADEVLVIRKKQHEGFFSFMGGHVEREDGNGQTAALRERKEEILGIDVGQAHFICNEIIEDPRYRGTKDAVLTGFYRSEFLGGTPAHGDDADEVAWVKRFMLPQILVPWHRKLGAELNAHWNA